MHLYLFGHYKVLVTGAGFSVLDDAFLIYYTITAIAEHSIIDEK